MSMKSTNMDQIDSLADPTNPVFSLNSAVTDMKEVVLSKKKRSGEPDGTKDSFSKRSYHHNLFNKKPKYDDSLSVYNSPSVLPNYWVLFKLFDGRSLLHRIEYNEDPFYDKKFDIYMMKQIPSSHFLEKTFGCSYQINRKNVELIKCNEIDRLILTDKTITKDNRDLQDDNSAQSLGQQQLSSMKELLAQGIAESSDIIQSVIISSTTFSNKNEFSQDKYIMKKQAKYQNACRLFHPDTHRLTQHFWDRSSESKFSIRPDSQALLLSLSGLRPGCQVLVVDETKGLLAGSLLERLNGMGKLIFASVKGLISHHKIEYFNFTSTQKDIFTSYSLSRLLQHYQTVFAEKKLDILEMPQTNVFLRDESDTKTLSCDGADISEDKEQIKIDKSILNKSTSESEMVQDFSHPHKDQNRGDITETEEEHFNNMDTKDVTKIELDTLFDSLIVATQSIDPLWILKVLQPLLKPSRNIVFYSPYKEMLVPAFIHARQSPTLVNVQLVEPWYRSYQVLPGRIHPEMRMSSSGGYLLSITTVLSD